MATPNLTIVINQQTWTHSQDQKFFQSNITMSESGEKNESKPQRELGCFMVGT